jgi:hypothetical protein
MILPCFLKGTLLFAPPLLVFPIFDYFSPKIVVLFVLRTSSLLDVPRDLRAHFHDLNELTIRASANNLLTVGCVPVNQ